jgi:hypothetical protein
VLFELQFASSLMQNLLGNWVLPLFEGRVLPLSHWSELNSEDNRASARISHGTKSKWDKIRENDHKIVKKERPLENINLPHLHFQTVANKNFNLAETLRMVYKPDTQERSFDLFTWAIQFKLGEF